ncbi:hypothetical protein [Sphingomonas sp. AX6]|uniref:hypothetical protein n=1 Tax=Sphingomonas sp. AX6 TaxID=2653171 RepID=UPI0012F2044B|nr:hypothetical protein [Sphingomonas sp. AX6]VXC63449.1 conserved hypothetical protein [Sphingomonas sp. AX6]
MSKQTAVLAALHRRISDALFGIQVDFVGIDGSEAAPRRAKAEGGRILISRGEPGDPEIDLCPPTYRYSHTIPVAFIKFGQPKPVGESLLDDDLAVLATAICSDPTLGGLCDWCEVTAPFVETEANEQGAIIGQSAEFTVIASYATSNPLI